MAPVKMYVTENCPYCIRAKRFFHEHNISYSEIDLTNNPEEIKRVKAETGWMTIPIIFIGDTLVGGYTDMMELHHKGELAKLLA